MTDQGMAQRLATSLREFVGRSAPTRPRRATGAARIVDVRPVVHGLELGVEAREGSDRASVFVFDTGAIVIEADKGSTLREELELWKEFVLETQ